MKVKAIILTAVVTAVLTAYTGAAYYFSGRFFPNTKVNGTDVSLMTAEKAAAAAASADYPSITLKGRGNSDEIRMDRIGFSVSCRTEDMAALIRKQLPITWISGILKESVLETKLLPSFDTEKLRDAFRKSELVSGRSVEAPENACIHVGASSYEISPEKEGTMLDEEAAFDVLSKAVSEMRRSVDFEKNGCYLAPQVRSDDPDLNRRLSEMTAVVNRTVKIDVAGTEEEITPEMLFGWSSYDGEKVTIREDAVDAYVDTLVEKYTTYGKERKFRSTLAGEITVGGGEWDCYGDSFDKEKTAEAVRSAVIDGTSEEAECVMDTTANDHGTENGDIGYTYIEVSIDAQKLWYYENGTCVLESDVVTGLPTERRSTPKGVFRVIDKLRDHTMTGSYGSAYANYVIPITWDGVCIHDASWRSSYGGDIYTYDGSHGCINTPYSKVRELFNMVDYGTPVVVY